MFVTAGSAHAYPRVKNGANMCACGSSLAVVPGGEISAVLYSIADVLPVVSSPVSSNNGDNGVYKRDNIFSPVVCLTLCPFVSI